MKEKKLKDYHNEIRKYIKDKAKMKLYTENFTQYIEEFPIGAENLVKLDISEIMKILEQLEIHLLSGTDHYACPLHFIICDKFTEVIKVDVINEEIIIQGNWQVKIKKELGVDNV